MQKKEKKKGKILQKNSLGEKWHSKRLQSIKVALVYDRVNKFGGAERVLLALHKIFPDAPLYTSVYDGKRTAWAKKFKIKTSFLQRIPLAKKYHQFFAPLMPLAFRTFNFEGYDIVISITSESAKAIRVRNTTKHICICLTPTRYLWSGYEEYFSNNLFRRAALPLIAALRFFDKKASQNPHQFLAISKEVQRRIKKYYGRNSEVIYPPMTLGAAKSQITSHKSRVNKLTASDLRLKTKDYFLVVSRLSRFTSYKRIDLVVQAATKLQIPLVVVGPGNQRIFKKRAGPTVTFVGAVSDRKLQSYYKNAKALIFPGKEDFGLVIAEAQAAGIPVIAYKAGGALEIIKEAETGIFFSKQTVKSLTGVLKLFDESQYNSKSIRENAKRFSFSHFEKALKAYILKALHGNSKYEAPVRNATQSVAGRWNPKQYQMTKR